MSDDPNVRWLVWSNERGMWWRPGGWGYTTLTHKAALFTEAEARAICERANIAAEPDKPEEVMCRAPWRTWAREEFENLTAADAYPGNLP